MKRTTLSLFSFYVMLEDDKRFKMKAGDIFIGQPYRFDPDKTSVGFRIKDGYDPGCNQYNTSIRPLTDIETQHVLWGKIRKIPPVKTPKKGKVT